MTELVAIIATIVAWIVCTFTVLQLADRRAVRGLFVMGATIFVGVVLIVTHQHGFGFGWLRSERLRSDALAMAALPAAIATCMGVLVDRTARESRWALVSSTVSSFACGVVGMATLALGRSSWYWEFVAIFVSGVLLLVTGSVTVFRRSTSPNIRIVFSGTAIFGAFLVIGGILLLIAWRSIS